MIKLGCLFGFALVFLSATALASAPSEPVPPPGPSGASEPPTPPAPPEGTATTLSEEPDPLDVIVCKTEPPVVGSRLGKRKICKTRREWRDEERELNARHLPDERATPLEPGLGSGGVR